MPIADLLHILEPIPGLDIKAVISSLAVPVVTTLAMKLYTFHSIRSVQDLSPPVYLHPNFSDAFVISVEFLRFVLKRQVNQVGTLTWRKTFLIKLHCVILSSVKSFINV